MRLHPQLDVVPLHPQLDTNAGQADTVTSMLNSPDRNDELNTATTSFHNLFYYKHLLFCILNF